MTVEQLFGYARAFMDSFGITPFVYVILILGVAFYVYNRFFNRD